MASTNNTANVETVKKTKANKGKGPAVEVVAEASSSTTTVVSVVDFEALKQQVLALTARVVELEAHVSELPSVKGENSKPKKEEKEKKPRAPTAYNMFMKEKMKELKETQPGLNNIERMKIGAEAWTASKSTDA